MAAESHAVTAVERLQSRLPASLYEIAWQYSLLDWFESMLSDDIDWDLDPEHLAYLTPGAQSNLFGEDDSLVTVYADLSDLSKPRLRSDDEGGPVEIATYTEGDRFRIGHSYPANKTSSMTDYSITTYKNADAHHIAGLRDDAWGTNNIRDRFTGWAQSEYAEVTRERVDDEDAAVLDGLAAIGDDKAELDRLTERFLDLVEAEDVEVDALITVRVRLPGESRYKYPGEVNVLNEVMVQKKRDRLENVSVEEASGSGIGYVSEEDGRVTGGSPGLFGMYGKKQREHIPNLDPKGEAAWRIRALDFDVAAAIAATDSILDDFYRGLGQNRRLYILPYLAVRQSDTTPEEFEWFYETVWKPLRDAEGGADGTFDDEVDAILRSINEPPSDTDNPFDDVGKETAWGNVCVASVLQVTGNPDRVYFDTLDATHRAGVLEDQHNRVLDSPVFHRDGIFAEHPPVSSSPLLGQQLRLHRQILYGGYFERTTEPTRSSRQAAETPTAGAIDDHRMNRVRRFLSGESLSRDSLLETYINQLVQDQREAVDSDEGYIPFPRRSVVEQYVQLRALTEIDALTSNSSPLQFTTDMTSKMPADRTERLETFIESHDALSESTREAVFVLGGLVGRITAYQHREGIASTLVRRYPIDYLTKQTVQEVTKEVLQMDSSYAEAEENRTYWTNSRYHERLTDAMLASNPIAWNLTEAELQWLYSLGITYGLNDTSIGTETADDAETVDDTATA